MAAVKGAPCGSAKCLPCYCVALLLGNARLAHTLGVVVRRPLCGCCGLHRCLPLFGRALPTRPAWGARRRCASGFALGYGCNNVQPALRYKPTQRACHSASRHLLAVGARKALPVVAGHYGRNNGLASGCVVGASHSAVHGGNNAALLWRLFVAAVSRFGVGQRVNTGTHCAVNGRQGGCASYALGRAGGLRCGLGCSYGFAVCHFGMYLCVLGKAVCLALYGGGCRYSAARATSSALRLLLACV